jgi:SAM-dependent methyltransferase
MTHRPINWHERYLQQSLWTRPLRDYLFQRIGLERLGKVLEVGCGTGALLEEMERRFPGEILGLDLNVDFLRQASANTQRTKLIQGNGFHLPFPQGCFDLAYCHFLLLWVNDPLQVIAEMRRVIRPGGHILALAEPDYGGRIDYPFALQLAGQWQTQALLHQGADPQVGRRLGEFFTDSGLGEIQTGLLGGEWKLAEAEDGTAEWDVLVHDLRFLPDDWDQSQVDRLKRLDREARHKGTRVLFIPVFYAWGRK